jgi:HD-like signal output (HDOD) protein
MAPGECLSPEGGGATGCYVVIDGSLELRATADGAPLVLGVVSPGGCFGLNEIGRASQMPCEVAAREPATVYEVGRAAFELLPPVAQQALARLAASGAGLRFGALAERHAELARRNTQLVARLGELSARANRALASPALRQVLSQIPALPVYATDLASKLLDERTHADEVVESIKNNASLASLVLKRVNSAYYGLGTAVSDYYHAVLLLGTNAVYQLVLQSAVESVGGDRPERREIDTRAHLVSLLAHEIARASGKVNPLFASTVGLLHNIGETLALHVRSTWPTVADLVGAVDAPALGAAVLAGWGLPERVHRVVGRQQEPEDLLPGELGALAAEIGVLYLARACHEELVGRPGPTANMAEYMAFLGLSDTSCAGLCRNVLRPALARAAERLPARVRERLAAGRAAEPSMR